MFHIRCDDSVKHKSKYTKSLLHSKRDYPLSLLYLSASFVLLFFSGFLWCWHHKKWLVQTCWEHQQDWIRRQLAASGNKKMGKIDGRASKREENFAWGGGGLYWANSPHPYMLSLHMGNREQYSICLYVVLSFHHQIKKKVLHALSLSLPTKNWVESKIESISPVCLCFFIIWLKVTKVLYYIFPKPALKYTTHWKSFCVRNFDTQLTPGNYKQLLVISETPACSLKSYTVLFSFASIFFSNFFHNL